MKTMLASGRIPATRWIFDCSPTDYSALRSHHEDDSAILARQLLPMTDVMHPYGPAHEYWDGPLGDFWVVLSADYYATVAVDPEGGEAAWAVYDWGTDDCVDRGKGRVATGAVEEVAFLAGRALSEALS